VFPNFTGKKPLENSVKWAYLAREVDVSSVMDVPFKK